jgi:hypothetical protein
MKRTILIAMLVVPVIAWTALLALYGAQSSEALILTCVSEDGRLPQGLACAYLTLVRDPDPNQDTEGRSGQTVFGFTVVGHHQDNVRSAALIKHFMDKGIEWNAVHDAPLTPLHVAVLFSQEALAKSFIEAGASHSRAIEAPGKAIHGMNALDFARMLKAKAKETGNALELAKHGRMEEFLMRSGAKPGVPSP